MSSQTLENVTAADPHFWVQGTWTDSANQGVIVPLQGERKQPSGELTPQGEG